MLLDEASLDYLDASSACFAVVVRSEMAADAPLEEMGARCTSGEASAEATVNSETGSLYDYDERGAVQVAHAEGTPATALAELELEPPAHGHVRVVERHARLCCAMAAAGALELTIGTASFGWELE
jgi:hypothetical protein